MNRSERANICSWAHDPIIMHRVVLMIMAISDKAGLFCGHVAHTLSAFVVAERPIRTFNNHQTDSHKVIVPLAYRTADLLSVIFTLSSRGHCLAASLDVRPFYDPAVARPALLLAIVRRDKACLPAQFSMMQFGRHLTVPAFSSSSAL